MNGHIIINRKHQQSDDQYFAYAKEKIRETLISRLPLIGMTLEDLEDINKVKKHRMGRDDDERGSDYRNHTYRALGISLVSVLWTKDKCIISTPIKNPDYKETVDWISSYIPRK